MIWAKYNSIIMKYQKIRNMLDNTPNHPTRFMTRSWLEINYDECGTYNIKSQIKFKNSMLNSSLCRCSDAYTLASGTITIDVERAGDNAKWLDERNRGVIFKNCTPFTDGLGEVNNTLIDNAKDLDAPIPIYGLIEYWENYLKTSGSLWQYYRVDPNDILTNSESSKFNINR